ncbi:alpha/beta-hydrolase [Obba rivulosa]|uniref:Alpha/beta-hydrolase n=1 Tax=Obba rivulosa TaxID=1052685 RepID=A0A8E2APU7_9APHY|nr:alpha/beta-hydrolase [Obba rivulosa]
MPFAFRHQPIKTIYTVGTLLYLLCCLPVWTVVGLVPAFRPRRSWTLKRTLIVKSYRVLLRMMFNTAIIVPGPPDKYASTARESGFVWVDATPDLVNGEIRDMAQINEVKAEKTCGFWYGPRGSDGEPGQRASEGEKVVYHMHGGGYIMGTAHPSNKSVVTCFNGFLEHFGPNVRIFAIEYRKSSASPFAPANPFPAALLDVIAGYRYLVEDVGFAPKNIIVGGDSAGGGLAFDLALYLAANSFPSLASPAGLLLLSPSLDWAVTQRGRDSAMVRNDASDFVQGFFDSGYTRRALLGALPEETAATSVWLGPGSLRAQKPPGAWAQLPPACIVAGGAEISIDPMRTLRDRMQEDVGKEHVEYIELEDAAHDPFTLEWLEPERTEGLRQVGAWVQKIWAEHTP